MKKLDLTGFRSGSLTVVSECPERSKTGAVLWNCICDCGKSCIVNRGNLTTRHINSCGCSRKEEKNIKWRGGLIKKNGYILVLKRNHPRWQLM